MLRTKIGVDKYEYDIIKITDEEDIRFYCEHCGYMKAKVYYDIGDVTWCELCKDTLDL